MTKGFQTALYVGDVWHKRRRPKKHAFRYPIYYLMLDLDAFTPDRTALPKGLSLNAPNLFSVYEKDYGLKDGSSLKDHVLSLVKDNVAKDPARVMMLTMPRLLGYGFNPLTVFFCLSSSGETLAIVYEVHSTFGESHSYIYCADKLQATVPLHDADKSFHVSPFYPVEGTYRFRVREQAGKLGLAINYLGRDGVLDMTACLAVAPMPLTARNLMRLFLKIPFVTFKVTAAIHYEALRLWLKKLKVFSKPEQAKDRIQLARVGHADSQTKRNGG